MKEKDQAVNQLMVKYLAALLGAAVIISGALFASSLSVQPVRAQTGTATEAAPLRRSVSVNGTGSASVLPDMAVITLGVQSDAPTAREALTENNEQMDAVLSAVRQAGIANADIRTQAVQLYPRYDTSPQPVEGQGGGTNNLTGFTAANTVEITVRDIENLGALIDQSVTAGSNQIQGIRFDVSAPNQALDEAREAALSDARHKAQQLAELTDSSLGQVITVTEGSRGPIFYQNIAVDAIAAEESVPVAPGSQMVTVDVQVTWELQP